MSARLPADTVTKAVAVLGEAVRLAAARTA
jgi:hypothetical protein